MLRNSFVRSGVERVQFVCFDEATAMVYERVLGEA